jgi:DNA polymerase V
MFALVDAAGMYASCEKIFDPSIRKRPVVVLSNNDGCVVAACPMAKKLNIPMFGAYFQIKDHLAQHGVVIRSSNYELYADISARMMDTCARFAPDLHIYSIDECFLSFLHFTPEEDFESYAWRIRRTVWKEVRLPVGIGVAATPSLAKIANYAAKRLPGFRGVAVIDSETKREQILKQVPIDKVWGVGRRLTKQFLASGIHTGWDLANTNPALMRKHYSIKLSNLVYELNGQQRMSWDDVRAPKKEIYSTRSFGDRVSSLASLQQAVAQHVGIAAEKLRRQSSKACAMIVFAHNSPHDVAPYYRKSHLIKFDHPTADTRTMTQAASRATSLIFREHVRFYKCGVGLIDLVDDRPDQSDLFITDQEQPEVMVCMDKINHRFGKHTAFVARESGHKTFAMRREWLSRQYTTRIDGLMRVGCY